MLVKKVNIYPSMPITGLNPVIRTATKNVFKSVEEIKICINARAIVEEILGNGKTLRLNLSNYDKDNITNKKPVIEEAKKAVEEVKNVEKAPEIKEQTVETAKAVEMPQEAKTEKEEEESKEPAIEEDIEKNPSGEEAHMLFDCLDYSEVDEPTDEKVDFEPDDEKGL